MVENGWVIQRDDGAFFRGVVRDIKVFNKSIRNAFIYCNENLAKEEIYYSDLHSCKVLKVEIKVVQE